MTLSLGLVKRGGWFLLNPPEALEMKTFFSVHNIENINNLSIQKCWNIGMKDLAWDTDSKNTYNAYSISYRLYDIVYVVHISFSNLFYACWSSNVAYKNTHKPTTAGKQSFNIAQLLLIYNYHYSNVLNRTVNDQCSWKISNWFLAQCLLNSKNSTQYPRNFSK